MQLWEADERREREPSKGDSRAQQRTTRPLVPHNKARRHSVIEGCHHHASARGRLTRQVRIPARSRSKSEATPGATPQPVPRTSGGRHPNAPQAALPAPCQVRPGATQVDNPLSSPWEMCRVHVHLTRGREERFRNSNARPSRTSTGRQVDTKLTRDSPSRTSTGRQVDTERENVCLFFRWQ